MHARYYWLFPAESLGWSFIHEPSERWADSHCYTLFPEVNRRAQRLLRHRTTQGLSQKEAALEIGVDHGTLAKWVRRKREPALGAKGLSNNNLATSEALTDGDQVE